MKLRGSRVLVTGADGFIGSHLVEALVAAGASVRAMTLYNSIGSWGWLETLPAEIMDDVDVRAGDVRDPSCVSSLVSDIDAVFHLAALIAIPYSYSAPTSYVDTNVSGTLNVLEATRNAGTELVVLTSTSEVYGTAQYVPIDERHPLQGQSPYSASKIAADMMGEAYSRSFDLPVVVARPFNTYGPRQSARAVIPTIASQLLSGITEVKLGALKPTRDFNYVTDTCAGFLALAAAPDAVGRVVNVGSGSEASIEEVAKLLGEIVGVDFRYALDEQRLRPEASEVDRLVCDPGLIRQLTDWVPRVDLKDGLSRTVDWLRSPENLGRYKPNRYSV